MDNMQDRQDQRCQAHERIHGHDHDHHHEGIWGRRLQKIQDHPHVHSHNSCGCGHEHSHEHGHDACGCEHDHEHSHDSCGCGHDHHHHHEGDPGRERLELILGAALFGAALLLHFVILKEERYSWPCLLMLVGAYLLLGHQVLATSLKNIAAGEIFDENFLMSIATLGAFAIGEYPEAVGVMLFFRLGEMFEEKAVANSRRKILEAVNLRAETVTLAEGSIIPAGEARPGQRILVSPGDRIPLDGIIEEGESYLDMSALNGEPVPCRVGPGDSLLAGSVNLRGLLTLRVEKPLSESMTSRILQSVEEAQEQKPKIEHFITRFARVYTPIVVGLALFTALAMPLIRGEEFLPWIYTAISFLVMSCPCALVVSVPLAFFCGIGTASGRGILFKGGAALEALARAKGAIFDKTGTLTRGEFELSALDCAAGHEENELLALAAACEKNSRHPIGQSIVRAAKERGLTLPPAEEVTEYSGRGIRARVKGGSLWLGSRAFLREQQISVPFPELTVGSEVCVARGDQCAGRLIISDSLKEDAREALERLKAQGLIPAMLTGDRAESAEKIAAELGITRLRSALLPHEKLKAMQELRETLGPCLFVGDGLNDAPVLAGADVGAAMGSGADAALEAADLVFMNSHMQAVPEAVGLARRSLGVARQNVAGALAIKIAVMFLGLSGIYSNMWLAVFADTGVLVLCILNALRLLRRSRV